MSEDLNRVILLGRLTRDSELQYTNSGYPVCKMSIAVNRRVKKGDSYEDEGNFFDLVLWGKRGESLNQYLVKGQQIAVEGQLKQDRWEQDGNKRSRVVIELSNVQLVGGRNQEGSSQGQNRRQQGNQSGGNQGGNNGNFEQYSPPTNFEDDNPYGDNVPF